MALIQGTGISGGASPPKKKKRDEEERRLPQPKPVVVEKALPQAQRAQRVVAEYYRKTGVLPSAEKVIAFTQVTQKNKVLDDPTIDIFPSWVRQMHDPEDIKVWEWAIDRVRRQMEVKPKDAKLTALQVEAYDYRTQGRRASEFLHKPTGKIDDDVRKASAFARQTGQRSGTLMDPASLIQIRKDLKGKSREELTDRQIQDVEALGLKFTELYDETDGFAKNYDNDTENFVWDDTFDAAFQRYVFFANLPYVLIHGKSADPKDKEKADIAMRNIEIGAMGIVKAFKGKDTAKDSRGNLEYDDLYDMFAQMAVTGDPNDGRPVNDEMAGMLYAGFRDGRRDIWTDARVIATYVNEFGKEYLPQDLQVVYDTEFGEWEKYAAKADDIVGQASEASYDDAFLDAMFEDLSGIDLPEEKKEETEEGPDTRSDLEKTFAITGKAGSKEMRDYVKTYVAPAVNDIMRGIPLVSQVLDGITWYSLQKNRIALTAMLLDEQREYETYKHSQGEEGATANFVPDPGDTKWTPLQERREPSGIKQTIGNAFFMGNSLGLEAWDKAGEMARLENQAFTKRAFKDMGLDPEEHKTLVFGFDLGFEIATDLPFEFGAAALARAGFTATAKVAARGGRAFLSPKLLTKVKAAEADLIRISDLENAARAQLDTALKSQSSYVARAASAKNPKMKVALDDLGKREGERAKAIRDQSAANRLDRQKAAETLDLLKRPHWYDTVAEGLARGTQEENQIRRMLSIDEAGMTVGHADGQKRIIQRIAASRDADEITELLTKLSHGVYAQRLDPGALWLGKLRKWDRATSLDADNIHGIYGQGGRKLSAAVEAPYDAVEHLGRTTNMGLPKYMRKEGNEQMQGFMRQLDDVRGATWEEIGLKRQNIYRSMQAAIKSNMENAPAGLRDLKTIRVYSKLHGVTIRESDIVTQWDAYKAFQKLKVSTGRRWNKEQQGPFFDEFEPKTPFRENQLAKDLVDEHNMLDLANFLDGKMRSVLWQDTGMTSLVTRQAIPEKFALVNPSLTGMSATFRNLAIIRVGFPFTALMIDEAWRLFFEGSSYRFFLQGSAKEAVQYRKTMKEIMNKSFDGEMPQVSRAFADTMPSLLKHTDKMVEALPGQRDYALFLNSDIAAFAREGTVRDFFKFERLSDESMDDYMLRFRDHLTERFLAPTETSAILREHAGLMHRGINREAPGLGYVNPKVLQENKAQWKRSMDAAQEVSADAKRVQAEAKSAYDALKKELGDIPNSKPPQTFVGEWIRSGRGEPLPIPPLRTPGVVRKSDEALAREGAVLSTAENYARKVADYDASIETAKQAQEILDFIKGAGGYRRNIDVWDPKLTRAENNRINQNLAHPNDELRDIGEMASDIKKVYPGAGITDGESLRRWIEAAPWKKPRKPARPKGISDAEIEKAGKTLTKPGPREAMQRIETPKAFSSMKDDEIVMRLADDPELSKQVMPLIERDWRRMKAKRKGGSDLLRKLDDLPNVRSRYDDAKIQTKNASAELKRKLKRPEPRMELDDSASKWLDEWVNKLRFYESVPELSDALRNGTKISRKQADVIQARLQAEGRSLPHVAGVRSGYKEAPGYIPGLSYFGEKGPFKLLEWLSNRLRKKAFIGEFSTAYDEIYDIMLQGRNLDELMPAARTAFEKEVAGRAGARAAKKVDRMMYTPGAKLLESRLYNFFYFLPAYRQAAIYWARKASLHPLTMGHTREAVGDKGYAQINVGDYSMSLPVPLYAFSAAGDMAIPGLAAPILIPLRWANTATGWRRVEDNERIVEELRQYNKDRGIEEPLTIDDLKKLPEADQKMIEARAKEEMYTYTGATKMDWMADIPGLTFTDKGTSPLMWINDIVHGVAQDHVPDMASNRLMTVLSSGLIAWLSDPVARDQIAENIAQGEISMGRRPDVTGSMVEMDESGGIWSPIMRGAANMEHGDAYLGAVSRLFFLNRIKYRPSDIGTRKEDKRDFFDKLLGDGPRTMAEAQWEYRQAFGDPEKQREVLDKYPKLAAVENVRTLNAQERAEYLVEHPDLIPYVTSKNTYKDGVPLIGGEYHVERERGIIRTKSYDAYLGAVKNRFANAKWTETYLALAKEHDAALLDAKAWAMKTIDEISKGRRPEYKEQKLYEYNLFYNGWLSGPVPEEGDYEPIPGWLDRAARKAGIRDDRAKWDISTIQERFDKAIAQAEHGSSGSEEGLRPSEVQKRGLIDTYSNAASKNWDEATRMKRITDYISGIVSPRYKHLVDPAYSMSAVDIEETLATRESLRKYKLAKAAGGEWWKLTNSAEDLMTIGIKVSNPDAFNDLADDLDNAYQDFKDATEKVDYGTDVYLAERAKYHAKREKMLESPLGKLLQDGPAGRLIQTYLADPGGGRKVDKNFINHALAVMKANDPDTERLLSDWLNMGKEAVMGQALAERMRSSTAWATVLSVAVMYRRNLKGIWNEQMKSRGKSPSSKDGEEYQRKLRKLIRTWESISPRFKDEWNTIGGDKFIMTALDADN
jgi:hypothetical protein